MAGNSGSVTANHATSSSPRKKLGIARPTSATASTPRPIGPLARAAAMPSPTPSTVAVSVDPTTSDSVTGRRLPSSDDTGSWLNSDRPRSPCTAPLSQSQ